MAVLLADIGGTNARFCLYEKEKVTFLCNYLCDDFKTAYDVIDKAIQNCSKKLTGIAVAGAGPVQNEVLKWTNRSGWKVQVRVLKKKYNLKKVIVINDVHAQGEGLKTLYKCAKTTLLMTAGTGLGSCFIVSNEVIPGEVGQIQTSSGLKVEETVSGPGIVRLYHFFGGNKKINSAHKIEEMYTQKDKIAVKALITFYQEWGKIAARLATGFYATGGVYLWGGLIPKTPLDKQVLITAYKNTLPQILQKTPIRFVKEKALTFKGLVVLLHREFGRSSK